MSEGHIWVGEWEAQGLSLRGPLTWLFRSFYLFFLLPPLSSPVLGVGDSLYLVAFSLGMGWGLFPSSPRGSDTQPRTGSVSLTLAGPSEHEQSWAPGISAHGRTWVWILALPLSLCVSSLLGWSLWVYFPMCKVK